MNSNPNLKEVMKGPDMNEVRRIPLAAINVDPAIQQRVNGISEDVVEQYAQAMRDGAKFPPLLVFYDGTNYHLGDGFHRRAAHPLAHPDVQEIECEVHDGNREDAIVFACGANAGLRRGPSDQRKAIASLLRVRPEWPDREIARRCKVSPTLVAKVRKRHLQTAFIDGDRQKDERAERTPPANERQKTEVTAVAADRERIVVRDGKRYPMRTAGIGARRAKRKRRKKPEPFLTAFAWTMATELERAKFLKAVGGLNLVDALRANEPGLNLMNRVWESTEPADRQAFAKEHHEEIDALANPTRSTRP